MAFNNEALLAAASQILGASGPSTRPTGLGQILGGGMQAYMGAEQAARQRKLEEDQAKQIADMRALQMQEMQGVLSDKASARARAERMAKLNAGFGAQGQQAQAPAEIALGSVPMNSSMGQPQAPQAPPQGEYQRRMAYANYLRANGEMGAGDAAAEDALKFAPKVKAWEKVRDGGAVKYAALFEDGTMGQPVDREVAEKLEFRDSGQAIEGLDQYTGEVKSRIGKQQSLESIASNSVAMRGQNMTDSRQREMAEIARDSKPVKAPTEFQGKSAAYGLRATEADKIISKLGDKYSPAAINSKQTVGNTWLIGGALEAATNKFALSENDQMAEQAQRDFINATLRQESGAAIAADEFTNAKRQYFPQPGDSAALIAQKARNRQLTIQGFTSNAGSAAMQAPSAPATGGWSITRKD